MSATLVDFEPFGNVLDDQAGIIKAFAVLDHRYWPADATKLETFGDDDVKTLFEHFKSFWDDTSEAEVT